MDNRTNASRFARVCPHCGYQITQRVKSCPICGTDLSAAPEQAQAEQTVYADAYETSAPRTSEARFCPHCGSPITRRTNVCSVCGGDLRAVISDVQPAPEQDIPEYQADVLREAERALGTVCPECGAPVLQRGRNCASCGADLSALIYKRAAAPREEADPPISQSQPPVQPGDVPPPKPFVGIPRTIEDLQEWYIANNLPPEDVTRFFIGKNYKAPKAFGIYRDGRGNVVVYKNKADGTRAIRYQGPDEAFGANELYLRLKQEIGNQKALNNGGSRAAVSAAVKRKRTIVVIAVIVLIIAFMMLAYSCATKRGYYYYGDSYYYYEHNTWFIYDYGWTEVRDVPRGMSDYYLGSSYSSDYGTGSFYDSDIYRDYYEDKWETEDSWDDNDSWDSGGTDWDSDW